MEKRKKLYNWRKAGAAGIATAIAIASLTACGGNSDKNEQASNSSLPEQNVKFSIMVPFFAAQPPATDSSNPAFKALEDLTGAQLDVAFVPGSAYDDKVNVTLASGNLPQALVVTNTKNSAVINAIRSGAFWEVGPYVKDYPNLQKYWKDPIANNVSVDGKIYGIYRERPVARKGFLFRQDWLDNLGLQQPKTVDDIYNIAKAFTLNDPDKNGKDDTFGLALSSDGLVNDTMIDLVTALGGFNKFGIKDGKVTPYFMTPEYTEALKLLKKMYDEKLVNKDFGAIKGTKVRDFINQGKAGMVNGSIDDANSQFTSLYKLIPEAKIDFVAGLEGPNGVKLPANSGYYGQFMFPKSSVKTEADLKNILSYFDKVLNLDVEKLFDFGVEGVHHKVENGNPVISNQELYSNQVADLGQLRIAPSDLTWPTENDVMKKVKQMYKDQAPNAVTDVTEPFLSPTQAERGTDLDTIIYDASIKFIMGTIDEAEFTKATDEWRKQGGDKMIDEFTQEYNKVQSK
ncbi:extracellular solute-binding protein [Paenibacillus nasutitermitis]|uniref:ABC transporter peptide-binding protein YtcQ n=1 Tax=Paenibacillus nasutitermitis TaxID=1652958 RepID=A0A917E1W1_9BACL|nr:extracellular solute-binding protein [Paenibacillus nasutitermitis]GGD91730.1 putative ABC transporter peptide-binding protein YtcQ [Paenibacillus nasutitermitis]